MLKNIWSRIIGKEASIDSHADLLAIKNSKATIKKKQMKRTVLPVQEISIRKKQALVLPRADNVVVNDNAMQVQLEAIELGFIFTDEALSALLAQPESHHSVYHVLQSLVAADKAWKPLYPNFPAQEYQASEIELFLNTVMHYRTAGEWRPVYSKEPIKPRAEKIVLKQIGLIDTDQYLSVFTELLSANASLSTIDKEIIYSFLKHHHKDDLLSYIPTDIPFKETRCQLIADALLNNMQSVADQQGISSSTDVLRIATRLSGGDISLASNTRFSLKRRHRRWLVNKLEVVINEDDIVRYQRKWKRLFHCLHISTFELAPKSRLIADKLRNAKVRANNSIVEKAIEERSVKAIIDSLSQRPGEFARRIDHLLRVLPTDDATEVFKSFSSKITKVDTRVLVQMLGHFKRRQECQRTQNTNGISMTRVVLPKGLIANVKVLKNELAKIHPTLLSSLIELITATLGKRFATLPNLGKVWIDPRLKRCPVPLQMRSAAEGLKVVQRGSVLPMSDKNVLRFFIHWVGQDIDLSACFLTHDLQLHSEIAYYKLRSKDSDAAYRAVHSGDVTYAPVPEGACEFIDIDLMSINDKSIRYIAMDVRVYEGLSFPAQQANAGWMFRDNLGQEGEVFDASTVDQRIALSASTYSCMVAIFDIVNREVIWLDLAGSARRMRGGNNVASNRFNVEDLLEAAVNFKQLSLYDLLNLHASNRGGLVDEMSKADVCLKHELVYQYTKVNADFLA